MSDKHNYKAGSRKSQLAVIQTESVIDSLCGCCPDITCSVETMETIGDKILEKPLAKIGEKSLFTKDLEIALGNQDVDFIVHSLKDLPTALPENMAIGAILRRESPRDVVIFNPKHQGKTLNDLPKGSVIGTSSLRRIAQLRRKYTALEFKNVRGNLNTRLRKLDEGDNYDALVLAAAGIHRMNWQDRIGQVLQDDDCLYAVGQGALAVEVRFDDQRIQSFLSALTDMPTLLCCAAERHFLRVLEGGCSVPIGVSSTYDGSKLTLTGAVFSLDGKDCVKDTVTEDVDITQQSSKDDLVVLKYGLVVRSCFKDAVERAESIGGKLALTLKENGAGDILKSARDIVASNVDIHKPIKET